MPYYPFVILSTVLFILKATGLLEIGFGLVLFPLVVPFLIVGVAVVITIVVVVVHTILENRKWRGK